MNVLDLCFGVWGDEFQNPLALKYFKTSLILFLCSLVGVPVVWGPRA